MPFRKHARITVENDGEHDIAHLFYEVDYTLGDEIPEDAGYFHAQFRRQNPCPMHSDYTLLETTGKGCIWALCWACVRSTPRAGGARAR